MTTAAPVRPDPGHTISQRTHAALRHRATPLSAVVEDITDLHDELSVPLTAHARWLLARAQATRQPCTAVVVDDVLSGRVRAAALLTRRHHPFVPVAEIRLVGHGTSDELCLAAASGDAAEALADGIVDLLDRERLWHLHLEQLPAGDPVLRALSARLPHTRVTAGDALPRTAWPAPRPERGWAARKIRNQVRRAERAADESGLPWSIDVIDDCDSVLAALPETLEVRRARELDLSRVDGLASADRAGAHVAAISSVAEHGQVELWRLRHGGELVAYLVAGHDHGWVRLLDSRIRPGSEAISPGLILHGRAQVTWYADTTIVGVDFGRGASTFKHKWCQAEHETSTLHAWSHQWLETVGSAATSADLRARDALRSARESSPIFARTVRAVRRAQTASASRPGHR